MQYPKFDKEETPPMVRVSMGRSVSEIGPRRWPWLARVGALVASLACGFFTQYQAAAPCVIGFHFSYLSFVYMEHKLWIQYMCSLLVSIGLALSMSQIFRPDTESWSWTSAGIVLGIQAVVLHAYFLAARVHCRLVRLSNKTMVVFAYPVIVSCLYAVVCLFTPVGSQTSPAYAFADFQSLTQLVSLFGTSGLTFVVLSMSALLCHAFVIDTRSGDRSRRRTVIVSGVVIFFVSWLFGSLRLVAPLMYQRSVAETATPANAWVDAACIVRSGNDTDMVSQTRTVLAQGNVKLVLWSEVAGGVFYDDSTRPLSRDWQKPLLSQTMGEVKDLAIQFNATIGIAYAVWAKPDAFFDDTRYNRLTFVDPNAEMVLNYTKRYPVPVIESLTLPGNGAVGYGSSRTIGDFNAAICFDLDHPEFIRTGVTTGLLVQSANTWGIVGHYHAIGSAFRAIENGVHVVRCGSNGPSGLYDPYGNPLLYQTRADSDVIYFQVPVSPPRVWTVYSHFGFAFDYLLLVATGVYILILVISFRSRSRL